MVHNVGKIYQVYCMVPKTGIEPVRKYKFRRILSPVRLPVPPLRQYMAPRVGLEPTAYRLTAGCSTIELPWNIIGGDIQIRTGDQGVAVHCLTTWLCRLIKYYLGWIKRFELSISRATIWRFNQLSYTHHNGRGLGPWGRGFESLHLDHCGGYSLVG